MDLDRDTLLKLYTTMSVIRNFEERGIPETGQRRMSASVHSSAGQEAVPTGVCAHLTNEDYIGSTHRGHGHCIAKGVDPKLMMAELFGRSTGPNKGKGGSMHIADMSKGMLGTNGVVAASVPLAVGAALTSKLKKLGRVAVAFFGDGGANQGVLHESMNLASVWKLPVIFCCENNGYAESTPVEYGLSITQCLRPGRGIQHARNPRRRHGRFRGLRCRRPGGGSRPRRRWPFSVGVPDLPVLRSYCVR